MTSILLASNRKIRVNNVREEVKVRPQLDEALNDSSKLCMSSDYNDNSAHQAYGASLLSSFLRRAAEKVNTIVPEDVPLKISEYGCATGGSSILPLKTIQDTVGDSRKLLITMNDLPMNDWDVLKRTVEPAFPSSKFRYEGKSMYGPVGDVHLAYSCFAQHWLSNGAPTGLPGGAVWANQLPRDNEDRKVWEDASKRDWADVLTIRAKEMVPGGFMVFHIQSATCSGDLQEEFANTMQRAKLAMIENSELNQEEASVMVCPEFLKAPDEVLAPLVSGPISRLWKVEEMVYVRMPCLYTEEQDDVIGSTNEEIIEKKLIPFLRSFTDSSFLASVGKEKTDCFWSHVRKIVGNDPNMLRADWMGTFISLRRTSVNAADASEIINVCA